MTEMVGKKELQKMHGTGSKDSYLVIAKDTQKNMQLGMKPEIGQKGGKILLIFRLRSAPISNTQHYTSTGASPKDVWAFPWENKDHSRASLARFFIMERGPHEAALAIKDLPHLRIGSKLNAFVQSQAPLDQWVITPDELEQWMLEQWKGLLLQLCPAGDPKLQLEKVEAKKAEFDKWYAETKASLAAKIAEASGVEVAHEPKGLAIDETLDAKQASTSMQQLAMGKKPDVKPNLTVIQGGAASGSSSGPADAEDAEFEEGDGGEEE